MAGLTSTGFTIKTSAEILAEIKASIIASPALNPNGRVNLGADSVLGILAAIMADKVAEAWQLAQAVYASQFRASAEGASLDSLAELIGTARLAASASTATITGTGTNGTVIPAGSRVGDPSVLDVDWITLTSVTIASGVFSVVAGADTTGPIAANAGTLTNIVTPIAGWTTATNAADADLGRDIQSDESLRQAMIDLIFAVGSGTPSSIRSAVLAVPGVTEAKVYENTGSTTNAFGVPGHCVEVIVSGGDDVDVAQAIYDNKPAGIGTFTATADGEWATDANGEDVDIAFSRPVDVPVFVYMLVEKNGDNVTADADLKAAVVTFGDELTPGVKLRRSRFFAPAYAVDGVVNITRLGVSRVDAADALAAATTLVDIDMAFRERATFDTARVTVATV